MLAKRRLEIDQIKEKYQGNERYHRIQEVKNKCGIGIKTESLEWLEGEDAAGYLRDMIFAQAYASENRQLMIDIILDILKVDPLDRIETVHNYINFKDGIIRKGAVSAQEGERFCLPFNMRDGVLICIGKGNQDWSVSSPHGCGRAMSRGQAKRELNLNRFIEEMEGIYSTSVGRGTIDESPCAYKDSSVIEEAIEPTATIVNKIKPILNLKDGEGRSDG
jgi:RNA-splicing ligase RtcB